jgi:hypothetical protein
MMTFNDIRDFVDIAADPEKYKKIIAEFDRREAEWKELLNKVTQGQEIAAFLANTQKEVEKLKVDADAMMATVLKERKQLDQDKALREEALVKRESLVGTREKEAADLVKLYTEKVKAAQQALLKQEQYTADAKRLSEEREAVVKEYQEKVDKLNAILK